MDNKFDHAISIAESWMRAFNEKNLESLLALYDDNAEHFSPKLKDRRPETKGLIKGKASLRDWWKDAFVRLPSLHYELIRLTPADDRIFMEYKRTVSGEKDLLVGEMLELKNKKIISSAVFHR